MADEHTVQLFKLQADICKTLADTTRLMILHELRKGEVSVGHLASSLDLPQSNISRHLAVLRERDIVLSRRDGTTVYYSIASPQIAQACDMVREMLKTRLARNQELANNLSSLKKI